MSNTKHYAKGSEKPTFADDGYFRLYSMRFGPCPIIAHLVLEAKGIPYHTVNINLTDKPEWLFEANPLGRVPCLQLVDKPGAPFVYESLLIAEYLVLDEVYPEPKIFPIDPLEKLQEKLWIERFTPITLKFYGAWMAKDPVVAIATWSETLDLLDVYETELKRRCTTYFGGDKHPTILDYALWPHFMRFEIVDQLFGAELSSARFPALVKWFETLNASDKGCRKCRIPKEIVYEYSDSKSKNIPKYDLMVSQ